jgi:hypothetical protein
MRKIVLGVKIKKVGKNHRRHFLKKRRQLKKNIIEELGAVVLFCTAD